MDEKRYHGVKCIKCGWKYIVPKRLQTKSCPKCGKSNKVKQRSIGSYATLDEARRDLKGNPHSYTIKKASDF